MDRHWNRIVTKAGRVFSQVTGTKIYKENWRMDPA